MTVTNLNKSPDTLLLELFNSENNTSYTSETLVFHSDVKLLEDGRTSLTVENKGSPEIEVPTAVITYKRIDLETLFSVVDVELREVDIINPDRDFVDSLILGEITRKYGVWVSPETFEIIRGDSGTDFTFAAKGTNVAYTGQVPINIIASLFTRVANKSLNGMFVGDPLANYITETNLQPWDVPVEEYSIARNTWYLDFSELSHQMALTETGELVNLTEVNTYLTQMGIPAIADGTVFTNQPTTSEEYNSKFDRVLVSTAENPNDRYYLHYNEI